VAHRRIVRPPTIPPGGAGIGPLWRVCDVQLTVDAVAGMWRSGRYPSVSSLASSPSMSTVMVPKKLTLSWWVGHRWASTSSWIRWATGAHFGDGAAVVLADPGDDRVGGDGQAPCLLGLLLGVVVSYRAFAGVEQVPAQRVDVLALVQLAGDFASVGLVG
jgi:hypothetical protein